MYISKKDHVFAMDKNHPPAAKVILPCELTFQTLDCFSEQITCKEDKVPNLDFDQINPATGPVYFEGVKAGDTIAVTIKDIRYQSPGKMVAAPGLGALGDYVKVAETLMVPIENGMFRFKDLELPVNPMVGVIGIAPAGEPVPCGTPDRHGGNMDTKLIKKGTTVYLPVQVDGGLLALGDLHAAMGDGEIMISGVEVSGEVDLLVEKSDDWQCPHPMIKTDKLISVIVSAETLDEAINTACYEMALFLERNSELTFAEAGMLMSACGDAEISQIVDPLKTARFSMSLDVLKKLGVPMAF